MKDNSGIDQNSLFLDDVSCIRRINKNNVEIRDAGKSKGRGVFAKKDFLAAETVLHGLVSRIEPIRSVFTIQLYWNVHAFFEEPGVVINHSCDPNVSVLPNRFGGYDFVALADIQHDAEICFDYAVTEYESIAVPNCECGSANCRTKSGGFCHLGDTHPLVEKKLVAPYLIEENLNSHQSDMLLQSLTLTGHQTNSA